ncbi:MAG: hypothetical protein ACI4T9_13105, partial [Prevotella sp.]
GCLFASAFHDLSRLSASPMTRGCYGISAGKGFMPFPALYRVPTVVINPSPLGRGLRGRATS